MLKVICVYAILAVVSAGPEFRVARGVMAAPHEFPSIVAIEQFRYGATWIQYCAGTLINKDTVITAGHCKVKIGVNTPVRVRAGVSVLSDDRATDVTVTKQIRHKKFQSLKDQRMLYDIMILKLDEPIKESKYIKYARLPEIQDKTPNIKTNCLIVGWGLTAYDIIFYGVNTLRKGTMTVLPKKVENNDRNVLFAKPAGKRQSSGCQGDSGGPLYCPSLDNGSPYQVGIVSGGDGGCGSNTGLARFARVDHFITWIRSHMN